MGEISGYGEYLAGLVAGVATVAIGHPFDTVKVKLQKHNTEAHGIKYRNGLHCTARILKTEGGGLQSDKPLPKVIIPTAAFGGAIVSFVLCPSELVKCRMQVQRTDSLVPISRRYSSPLDCALQTLKSEGATGIFRGGLTTFLRESLGNAVFFSVYEYVRYYMHSQLKAASFEHSNLFDMGVGIVSGGLGGVAVSIRSTPVISEENYYDKYCWCPFCSFHFLPSYFPVLVRCSAFGCGKNHHTDFTR
ncbi:mitochondrial arginine transporter BAC1 isoform X6 [Tripterygium wilfordii]|uniref:mitochondrial arginine transporter BAC1 isoform X6 n=1 Tax=Tripterygium wilfordii TaxID=458696 RepID=UPI0018F81040|nr:mitochondrial arginine transporter BAC1 isoform X6 [Tripterygium wilfordii]